MTAPGESRRFPHDTRNGSDGTEGGPKTGPAVLGLRERVAPSDSTQDEKPPPTEDLAEELRKRVFSPPGTAPVDAEHSIFTIVSPDADTRRAALAENP